MDVAVSMGWEWTYYAHVSWTMLFGGWEVRRTMCGFESSVDMRREAWRGNVGARRCNVGARMQRVERANVVDSILVCFNRSLEELVLGKKLQLLVLLYLKLEIVNLDDDDEHFRELWPLAEDHPLPINHGQFIFTSISLPASVSAHSNLGE
jgi:hypothetical protein